MYKVVPFPGIKGKNECSEFSKELENVINKMYTDGWDFVEMSNMNYTVQEEGWMRLFGQKSRNYKTNHLIFKNRGVSR